MKTDQIKKMTLTAMLTAMVCISTMFLKVPNPAGVLGLSGYTNLGDPFVLLSAMLLGPWYGAFAGGVGSALADLLTGYGYYAPGTLIIKGLVALLTGLFVHLLPLGKKRPMLGAGVGSVLGELWMVAGYWLYKSLILGNPVGAATSLPSNLAQGAAGVVLSLVMFAALRKILKK